MLKLKLNKEKYPWYDYYKEVPHNLEYFKGTMVEYIMETALKYPNLYALEYYNNRVTYKEFIDKIIDCAKALKVIGVKEGDIVSICMPNTPSALYMFYAVNLIGGVSNMIHPLSSEKEIEMYLNKTKSKVIMTIDFTYKKVINIINNTSIKTVIVSSAGDDLKGLKKKVYQIYKADVTKAVKKIKQVFLKAFQNRSVTSYKKFILHGRGYYEDYTSKKQDTDTAVILYSGGTSGTPKGINLSNKAFNALALEAHYMCKPVKAGDSILSIMPIFHGFGLGVCIHTCLHIGMKCILIPIFKGKNLGKIIRKTRPNFMVGVPTLFEALYNNKKLKDGDFSSINCIVSGGDLISEEAYNRYNEMFQKYGAKAKIRVGYGLTESCAATCLSPADIHKESSIGIPFPDTIYKIVKIGTTKEVKPLEDGEICISGPTLMQGYLDEEEETSKVLRKHNDGNIWLHTGDIGCIDEDGFIYFKSRLKRMIVSSGYNIYPSYIENIINKHEYVKTSTVIGKKDKYRGQIAKAYIVLKKEVKLTDEVKEEIKNHCKKYIAKYSMPRIFEFKKELPKTLVGKIAYQELEEETNLKERKDKHE